MGIPWLKSLVSVFSGAADKEPVVSDVWEDARENFFRAIRKENLALLDATIRKYPEALEWQSSPGTALFIALDKNRLASFRQLVNLGADINGKDIYGDSILHEAARGGKKDFVQILLERGAKPEPRDIDRATSNDRHETADLLKRANKIRAAWLAAHPPAAPPAAVDTNVATDEKITVLSPLQLKQSSNTVTP